MASSDMPADSEAIPPIERNYAEIFRRYRDVIADFEAFTDALRCEQPTCISANTLRVAADELDGLLREDGREVERIGWHSAAWRVSTASRPGTWWQFRAGLLHVQEEASLLPVVALAVDPGHRVLDLCAAPGGKTALIAMRLGNRGTILANDRSSQRLVALRDVNKRLGMLNMTATVHDGGEIPRAAGTFDRVLVDAPCSSEGTRWHDGVSYTSSERRFREHLARTQARLLDCAIERCRPGGRVVYSTCSFAPEENEAIVDEALRRHAVRVVPIEANGLATSPGLSSFEESRFSESLVDAVRLWPHVSGTGGFFAVALQKDGDSHAEPPEGKFAGWSPVSEDDATRWICERFGFNASVFARLKYFRKGGRVHAHDVDHVVSSRPTPVTGGLELMQSYHRMSTTGALLFGRFAKRWVVEVDRIAAEAYQRRQSLEVDARCLVDCDGDGCAIVRHRGYPLGLGLVEWHGDSATVKSEFPKAWVAGPDPDSESLSR